MGKNKGKKQKMSAGSDVTAHRKVVPPSVCPVAVKDGSNTLTSSELSDQPNHDARCSSKIPMGKALVSHILDSNHEVLTTEISAPTLPPLDPTFASIPDSPEQPVAADCDTGLGSTLAAQLNIMDTHVSSPVGSTLEDTSMEERPIVGVTVNTIEKEEGPSTSPQDMALPDFLLEKDCNSHVGCHQTNGIASSSMYRSSMRAEETCPTDTGLFRGHGYKYIALAMARLLGLLERAMVHTSEEIGRGCGIKKSLLRMATSRDIVTGGDVYAYVRSSYNDWSTTSCITVGQEDCPGGTVQESDESAFDHKTKKEDGDDRCFLNPNDASRASDMHVLRIVLTALWSCAWALWDLIKTIAITIVCSIIKAIVSFWMRLARRTISAIAWAMCLAIYMPLYLVKVGAYSMFPDLANTHTACVLEGSDGNAAPVGTATASIAAGDEDRRSRIHRVRRQSKAGCAGGTSTGALVDELAELGAQVAARAASN